MTQNEKILKTLKAGKTLTAAQARSRFGVQSLRSRIHELRAEGVKIVNRNGAYTLKTR